MTRTVIHYETAPQALLKDCPKVYIEWITAGDIVTENTALRGALSTCATQITGLQMWNQTLLKKSATTAKN